MVVIHPITPPNNTPRFPMENFAPLSPNFRLRSFSALVRSLPTARTSTRFIYHSNPLFWIMTTALVVLRPVTPPVRCGDGERTAVTCGRKSDLSLTLFHKRLCNKSRLTRKSRQVSYPPVLHSAPSQFACRIIPVEHAPNRTFYITKFCRLRDVNGHFAMFHLSA